MEPARYRAAATHLASSSVGLAATLIGIGWVRAAGEDVAVPQTLIVLSLLVLAPIAVKRSWHTRGRFVDHHVYAASDFLTQLAVAATVVIGVPVLISWPMSSGTEVWRSLLVLPYLGAIGLPIAWTFFAGKAAITAARGLEEPYPRWAPIRNLQNAAA